MTENMANEPTCTTAQNSALPSITEMECHDNLRKLRELGRAVGYYQVINDPDLVERYVELIMSMLGDDRATGRSFEELFPQTWLNSYREAEEICNGELQQKALPGLWPKEDTSYGWQLCEFYHQKTPKGSQSLPVFSTAAQELFVRCHLLPSAMGTLRGYLRHYIYGTTDQDTGEKNGSTHQRIKECLRILDDIKSSDYIMLLFRDGDGNDHD